VIKSKTMKESRTCKSSNKIS